MRNPNGYAMIVSPTDSVAELDSHLGKSFRCEQIRAGTTEIDTFQCGHCGGHIHVKPLAPMDEFGSMCRNCMRMTCPTCATGPCVPFEKKLQEMEQKDYIRRQYEMVMNS